MPYTNPQWVNDAEPAIDAENLNSISNTLEQVPVSNGGTGKSSFTAGCLLEGNGTGAFLEVSGSGALYSPSAGDPRFGTLPVNCGGTGVTTLTSLKSALGLAKAGWVAQNSAPTDTNVLWIDTANRSVIKYHNGSTWVACAGVFG